MTNSDNLSVILIKCFNTKFEHSNLVITSISNLKAKVRNSNNLICYVQTDTSDSTHRAYGTSTTMCIAQSC